MVYTLQTVIKFGKYSGSTIQEIIDTVPSYIEWAIDEIDTFELDEEATDYLHEALNDLNDHDSDDETWSDGWPNNFGDW